MKRKTLSELVKDGQNFFLKEKGPKSKSSLAMIGRIARLRRFGSVQLMEQREGAMDIFIGLNKPTEYKKIDKLLNSYNISTADSVWSLPGVLQYALPTAKPRIFLYVDSVTGRETQ